MSSQRTIRTVLSLPVVATLMFAFVESARANTVIFSGGTLTAEPGGWYQYVEDGVAFGIYGDPPDFVTYDVDGQSGTAFEIGYNNEVLISLVDGGTFNLNSVVLLGGGSTSFYAYNSAGSLVGADDPGATGGFYDSEDTAGDRYDVYNLGIGNPEAWDNLSLIRWYGYIGNGDDGNAAITDFNFTPNSAVPDQPVGLVLFGAILLCMCLGSGLSRRRRLA
jgi:hypothetical protein